MPGLSPSYLAAPGHSLVRPLFPKCNIMRKLSRSVAVWVVTHRRRLGVHALASQPRRRSCSLVLPYRAASNEHARTLHAKERRKCQTWNDRTLSSYLAI